MSKYFINFPKVQHDLTNEGQKVELTNILRRFKVESSLKNTTGVYNKYVIKDGDRPDIIAEKYYKDAGFAWVVLLFNEINDPIFDWPLDTYNFEEYIKGKYGSLAAAQAEVHEYRQIIREKEVKYDGRIIEKKYIVVDKTIYDTLTEQFKESVSKYDWEVEENEKKRNIKLLDTRYLQKLKDEVKDILRNGI